MVLLLIVQPAEDHGSPLERAVAVAVPLFFSGRPEQILTHPSEQHMFQLPPREAVNTLGLLTEA